jgi:hypothetical protein
VCNNSPAEAIFLRNICVNTLHKVDSDDDDDDNNNNNNNNNGFEIPYVFG